MFSIVYLIKFWGCHSPNQPIFHQKREVNNNLIVVVSFGFGMKPHIEDLKNKEKEYSSSVEYRIDSVGENVETDEISSDQLLDIKVIDRPEKQQDTRTTYDYSSPSRILQVERKSTSNEQEFEEIEVVVPQRDFGEEAVVVWDAGLVLAYYLVKHQSIYFSSDKENDICGR